MDFKLESKALEVNYTCNFGPHNSCSKFKPSLIHVLRQV